MRALILGVLMLLGAALPAPAHAARTVTAVLLSYGAQADVTSVTVPPGAVISARITVTHTGGGPQRRWFSTSWRIGGGAFTCVDHTQFTNNGTDSVTFDITAPATAGTYDAEFVAWQAAGCATNPSPTFTLASGVTVMAVVDNSTVSASPTSVPADGSSTATVTVTIRDASNNPVPGKTVSLAALSGSSSISPPSGPSNASGVVTFSVSDSVPESVTYRATNVSDGITLTQTATVTFTALPGVTFNVVEPGADAFAGTIFTKIAAATFKLDIVARSGGSVMAAFIGSVRVEIVDARTGGGDCANMVVILPLANETFIKANKGRRTIGGTMPANAYPDARVRIGSPAALPLSYSCSSDPFAIRPDAFIAFSAAHGDWQNPGATPLDNSTFLAGRELHKAGRPFSLRASAVNGAAKPAVTSLYAGTPRVVIGACGGAACTATFGALNLGAPFVAGQLASDAATYSEVGAFTMQLVDDGFAVVDSLDGSTAAQRNIVSPALVVGRFVPDHFAVAVNAPSFNTACGAFTYVGQRVTYAVAPVITVTARNFANTTTALYAGAWWRLMPGSLTPAGQAARYAAATGIVDVSGLPPPANDPAVAATGAGTGTLTFDSGTGIALIRAAPLAPFDADIALALNVIDADDVAATANPVSFGAATPGNGIAFTAGREMRFGRLRLQNAHGSQLIQMPLAVQAQYWNGTAFVTNTNDNCTAIAPANVVLGNYRRNLSAGETTVSTTGTLTAGVGTIRLSAPGAANEGSVDVSINLTADAPAGASCTAGMPASTFANLAHLQGAWCSATYTNDPTARATFGVYRSSDRVIFQRENY